MVIFPLEQLPEMARGAGVRLQRYKDGGLSDVKTFKAADGLTWKDASDRTFSLTLKELADWRGNRADAGRLAPKGFPRSNKFRRADRSGFLRRGFADQGLTILQSQRNQPLIAAARGGATVRSLCMSLLQLQIIRN